MLLEKTIKMFHWLRNHHRAETLEHPFPSEWEAFLRMNVAHYNMLDEAESAELRRMVQVFSWRRSTGKGAVALS